jgi:hypothetical protein
MAPEPMRYAAPSQNRFICSPWPEVVDETHKASLAAYQLKPVISTGAIAMNTIFGNKKSA